MEVVGKGLNVTLPNWQIVATAACIALAALIVLRRLIGLLSASGPTGCQTGGCSECPTQHQAGSTPTAHDFVSLESLVKSSTTVKEPQSQP